MKAIVALVLAFAVAIGASACGSSASGHSDAATSDIGPMADAFGGADFGQHCTTSADCGGGFCVVTPRGDVCTSTCDTSCPGGWNCVVKDVAGSQVSVCVPVQFDYCTPCTGDAQCSGGVCVALAGANSCLAECPFEGTCPTGYSCGADPSGVHDGRYCLPQTGTCSCTPAEQGQVRSCTTTNPNGTCRGQETCDPDHGGWIGCNATGATVETCDGLDNDCDQLIDEGVGGSPCAITVSGVGTCTGVTRCDGISGVVCEGATPTTEKCDYVDNDCDGTIDEGFPNLATVCSAGVGACVRYGVIQCTADGMGTQCSATAGAAVAELCNGLDDDCDGTIDETFPTLGTACTVGVGACQRQGNYICNGAKTGVTCAVTAGTATTEICNGLDDDCNGVVDDGFLDSANGLYDKNNACGSCSIDCTKLYALPNATGVCQVVSGTPTCKLSCNANAYDRNGASADGCEFALDPNGVYVSIDDIAAADDSTCGLGPTNTVGGYHPCLTIAQGIARANTLSRPHILVANGIYGEAVTMVNGRSLLGGYLPDSWQRDVASTTTYITGAGALGNHEFAVNATSITTATTLEGFVIEGPVDDLPSGNSYALYVSGSNGNLTIKNNVVLAGRGGPGNNGAVAAAGTTGNDGVGRPSSPPGYDAFVTTTTPCSASNNRSYTNGGAAVCSGNAGGNGGGNTCAPSSTYLKSSAIDGAGGGGTGAGTGGVGGNDSLFDYGLDTCYGEFLTSGWHQGGFNGGNGTNGGDGGTVAGCVANTGSVSGGHWLGGPGAVGNSGNAGGGGGGGAAGGGSSCSDGCPAGTGDQLGGGGGGGGSGGCGGGGGGAAAAGGGAFAIFIVGGSAPVITGNQLQRGQGGGGGDGGRAGAAGLGGSGAQGGVNSNLVGTAFCTGPGGRGGNGGRGGYGSGGGGACGGSSVAIYTFGIGAPNYCMAAASNTVAGGAAGGGGAGGYSIVHPGGAGTTGALATCSFN